jgi:hypothetical protein
VAEVKTNNDSDPTAYINYKATSTGKKPFATMADANPSYTVYSAEITDFDGDSTDDGLPDGTTYYVCLKSYNDEGDSAFGPYATRTTTATLPEILWKNVEIATDSRFDQFGSIAKDSGFGEDFYCWDSFYGGSGKPTGDFYIISPPSAEHHGGYLIYGPPASDTGVPSLSGEIVYFQVSYHSGIKGKWGEPLSGYAANIIVKYEYKLRNTEDGYKRPDGTRGDRWYMCVNFYGLGTVQSVGPPVNTLGPPPVADARGRILCYFGNDWDLEYKRNPETDTFEQAVAKFADGDKSLGSGRYIAGIATPWYRDYWIDRSEFGGWMKKWEELFGK